MKKLIGLLLLIAVATFVFASTHSDNVRYMKRINNSISKIKGYTSAYFDGVEINGQIITLTQAQKDALKAAANVELNKIKTYADSLNLYP